MSVHAVARLASLVSIVAFALCAAALVACSVVRELGEGRSRPARGRLLAARALTGLALLAGALAGLATLARIFATAYDS